MPTAENWRDRAVALLGAMADVRRGPHPPAASGTPTPRHIALFDDFVRSLRIAKQGAEKRWDAMVATEFGRVGDLTVAERTVAKRNPIGRAADPGVIAVVRRYWLECDTINRELPLPDRRHPDEILLGMLLDSPDDDLARFLSELPYWPIGLDAEGRWM